MNIILYVYISNSIILVYEWSMKSIGKGKGEVRTVWDDVKLSPLGFAYIIHVVPIDHHTVHRCNYSFIYYLLCVKHVVYVCIGLVLDTQVQQVSAQPSTKRLGYSVLNDTPFLLGGHKLFITSVFMRIIYRNVWFT